MGGYRITPAGSSRWGRPRETSLREVVNAIFYIAQSCCQWRLLPLRLWASINHELLMLAREGEGREASPSAGVIDSQSVKAMKLAVLWDTTQARRSKTANATF